MHAPGAFAKYYGDRICFARYGEKFNKIWKSASKETKKTNIENITHNAAANDVRREPSPLSFEQKRRDGVRITVWDTVQNALLREAREK